MTKVEEIIIDCPVCGTRHSTPKASFFGVPIAACPELRNGEFAVIKGVIGMNPLEDKTPRSTQDSEIANLEWQLVEAAVKWYADQLEAHEDCSASCMAAFEYDPLFTSTRNLIAARKKGS